MSRKGDSIFTLASCLKVGNVFPADGIRWTFCKGGKLKVLFRRLCKTRGQGRGEGSGKVPGVSYGECMWRCGACWEMEFKVMESRMTLLGYREGRSHTGGSEMRAAHCRG